MMEIGERWASKWKDDDAREWIEKLSPVFGEDLALRVYSSRLIGNDLDLVLHGGGNTSVKTSLVDVLGRKRKVLRVKGSGWDLASIQAPGFPALDLEGLRELRSLETLSDEQMLNELRIRMFDAKAPNPSVETLLHAFLPDKFVDHTHADAALVFGNRPEGPDELAELFQRRVGFLPWIMPGFPLAKAVAEYRDQNPKAIGLILHRHGVFSFGSTAQESYERMLEIVGTLDSAIEQRLVGKALFEIPLIDEDALEKKAHQVLPILRGLTSSQDPEQCTYTSMILEWRPSPEALAVAGRPDVKQLFGEGCLTPDHVIRTKGKWLISGQGSEGIVEEISQDVMGFVSSYLEYFKRGRERRERRGEGGDLKMLDPHPRIALIEGLGLIAFGKDKKSAQIAADIAEHTILRKTQADALSSWEPLCQDELFEMEYWSLEQAKLGKGQSLEFGGKVGLVTGGAGAIGLAIARRLLAGGAHVMILDLPGENLVRAGEHLEEMGFGGRFSLSGADVTSEKALEEAFRQCVCQFGGIDICVPTAGIAHVARIEELSLADWDRLIAVNQTGVLLTIKEALRLFRRQEIGGEIVLVGTKNIPIPGADFVAYSASKAGAVQVAKVAALEGAPLNVRVNMVHPDAVFDDESSGKTSGLWDAVGPDRMRSRGMDPSDLRSFYQGRNLLGCPVSADQVAEAVAFFAMGKTPTTGAALTVDGGHVGSFYR
jgi:rhamnose utilization protein RhaD (predicted bifunctional aldolase and dehydrogenase)/NAD(P)-dependent dehydrogenase (short-subunit alcohol dehydrogenase family)